METIVNITFYNEKDADTHYNNIKEIYQLYDQLADDFNPSSKYENIYSLNSKRKITAVAELVKLIEEAVKLYEDTNGYFNPLIGRIAHIWKDAITLDAGYPDADLISSELNIMNNTTISIKDNEIELIGDGNIDLGAMAKGYATEKVREYLKKNGVTGYLVSAGESSVLIGKKGDENFKIGLSKPFNSEYIKIVECSNTSVGTSSYKYQKKEYNEGLAHHLINPFTGYPANYYTSVNVMCESSILCDVYSTALFSMDIDSAKDFAKDKNIDILLFGNNEILYQSDNF
jgi:thiamine biosynthesis lipoprotein